MIVATRKVHLSYVLLLPSSWWWRGVGESWLLMHACHSRLGRTGRGLGTFDWPVLKPTFNSAKISWLVFLYRDFGEQIEDPRMFDVASETRDYHPCLPWISYATKKLILDSCNMVEMQSDAFHTFLLHFFQV